MKLCLPRLEISLSDIRENTRLLVDLYGKKGISLMGVSKATLGNPSIAEAMVQGGVAFIADSRLENIKRMKRSGLRCPFVLLRSALSQAEEIATWVDISLQTELEILKKISHFAQIRHQQHQVILMVEMGDLREGILLGDLPSVVQQVLGLPHLKLVGIGCNLACQGGIKPDYHNMHDLSQCVKDLERNFQIHLGIISGGNSANYNWYQSGSEVGRINNLRLGESILLGRESVNRTVIPGLHTHAFQLVAEVIEAKFKPSLPWGEVGQDAFGQVPVVRDRGFCQRSIIALGRQDVLVSGLQSPAALEILGSSSDHLVLHSAQQTLQVGDEVPFNLDYGGLLAAMTSPFIQKQFVHQSRHPDSVDGEFDRAMVYAPIAAV